MAGTHGEDLADEAVLVAAARDADSQAFGLLYRRYLPDVRTYCGRRIEDPGRAEDIAQETFVRAFQRIGSFRLGSDFWPWLQVIAKNLCIDEGRAGRHRRETSEPTPESPHPDGWDSDVTCETVISRAQRRHSRAVLADAFADLNPDQRLLLWQHDVEEMSYQEIAHARATTVNAVRNAAWRARHLLKATIGEHGRRLRAWILAPFAASVRPLWRWLARRRPRLPVAARGESLVAFLEGTTVLLVSAALLGSPWTLAPPQHSPMPRYDTAEVTDEHLIGPGRIDIAEAARGTASGGSLERQLIRTDIDHEPPREQGAGPSRVNYRLEIRDPNGEVIYWEETTLECGPSRPFEPIPDDGPVRAYC